MKLIETTFNNFRCFKHYHIQFGAQTTVFFGKNGTGKSSVLSGTRRGLSFMFARPKNFPKNLSVSNNAKVKPFEKDEANFDAVNKSFNYPIVNAFNATFAGTPISWSMVKRTEKGGYATNAYREVLQTVLHHYNQNQKAELPLLAVITDSFPHEIINFGAKAKKTVGNDILPRDLAYYGWDDRTSCLELWMTRFHKVYSFENNLHNEIKNVQSQIVAYENRFRHSEEGDDSKLNLIHADIAKLKERLSLLEKDERLSTFQKERQFIENKLIEFTRPVSKDFNFINEEFELFRVTAETGEKNKSTLEFNFNDGRVMKFEMLPMGYKRIFATVFDLAYRSYILNESIDSHGVVMVDEIELHLHPTLQQDILQRLRRSFPNVQFIITTHSPLVLSNFKSNRNNKIIKLEHEGNDYSNSEIENIYGIDYNTGLTEVMGANYRESELDKLIDSIVILMKFKKNDQANALKKELVNIVGEHNEHIQSEIDRRLAQNS